MDISHIKTDFDEKNHFKCTNWTDVAFPSHIHSHFEVILVKSGTLFVECASQTFELHANDMIIFMPFEFHTVNVFEKSETLILEASASYFQSANRLFNNKRYENPVCKFDDSDLKFIESHINRVKIHPEIEVPSLFYHLFSRFSANSPLTETKNFDRTLTRALRFISENSSESLTLKEVAEKLNINYVYLSRLFSNADIKFNDFLNQNRISKAVIALRNTKKSISDICFECGFGSLRNFNKVFLKKMNCTPKQFRDTSGYQSIIKGATNMNITNFEKKEWFSSRKWGICNQLPLYNANSFDNKATFKEINEQISTFDVNAYAKTLHELNAGYVIFSVMFCHQYFCAPNDTFNQITGFKPGDACSERDLIADLIEALKPYDIPLFLSMYANGPAHNEYAAKKFSYVDAIAQYINEEFVEKWSAVIREFAVRYGENIHGWFFHHAFDRLGFDGHDDDFFKAFHDAIKAGNKEALIAFNNGDIQVDYNNPEYAPLLRNLRHPNEKVIKLWDLSRAGNALALSAFDRKPGNTLRYSKYEDFTAGETGYFEELPISKYVEGSLWHKFGFMGFPQKNLGPWGVDGWNRPGSIYSGDYLYNYVKSCNEKGGVVTIDTCLFDDGHIDWGQYEILKRLSDLRR